MKQLLIFAVISCCMCSYSHAISKDAFLKLPFEERRKYGVIEGTYSSEYAIPREEYRKLSSETIRAINLEIGRQQFQYRLNNIGKKEKELDQSRLYDLAAIAVNYGKDPGIQYPEKVIDYADLGGRHPNHFEGAKYYYKDYLEWKKHELGQPSLWTPPGGDAEAISDIIFFYEQHKMYREWAALYADYNDFWWKRMAVSNCKQMTIPLQECLKEWLSNSNPDYKAFLAGWRRIKKLAKTTKPEPLSAQVQHHEWFYSDKQEEVLKALEYYHTNKVRFMLEKALKHKDPVISAKAKEYLDMLDKGEQNGQASK